MLNPRRSLRSLTTSPSSASLQKNSVNDSKRVHAQRKFATCGNGKEITKSVSSSNLMSGNSLKSSSTLTSSSRRDSTKRPKTEDFLTFLCLRGTSLLPPNLEFFNNASIPAEDSEESQDEEKSSPNRSSTLCNASVQALKRKYAQQRRKFKTVSLNTRSRSFEETSERIQTRSSQLASRRSTRRNGCLLPTAKQPIAKRKKQGIVTKRKLSRVSRMLTCLAPRGISNSAFVRASKKLDQGRSLRKREILKESSSSPSSSSSSSSGEEEEELEDEEEIEEEEPVSRILPKREIKSKVKRESPKKEKVNLSKVKKQELKEIKKKISDGKRKEKKSDLKVLQDRLLEEAKKKIIEESRVDEEPRKILPQTTPYVPLHQPLSINTSCFTPLPPKPPEFVNTILMKTGPMILRGPSLLSPGPPLLSPQLDKPPPSRPLLLTRPPLNFSSQSFPSSYTPNLTSQYHPYSQGNQAITILTSSQHQDPSQIHSAVVCTSNASYKGENPSQNILSSSNTTYKILETPSQNILSASNTTYKMLETPSHNILSTSNTYKMIETPSHNILSTSNTYKMIENPTQHMLSASNTTYKMLETPSHNILSTSNTYKMIENPSHNILSASNTTYKMIENPSQNILATKNTYKMIENPSQNMPSTTNTYKILENPSHKVLSTTNSYKMIENPSQNMLSTTNSYKMIENPSQNMLSNTNTYNMIENPSQNILSASNTYKMLENPSQKLLSTTNTYNMIENPLQNLISTSNTYKMIEAPCHNILSASNTYNMIERTPSNNILSTSNNYTMNVPSRHGVCTSNISYKMETPSRNMMSSSSSSYKVETPFKTPISYKTDINVQYSANSSSLSNKTESLFSKNNSNQTSRKSGIAVQCDLINDSSSGDDEGSIPLPPALLTQLTNQGSRDSSNETTYFIPLQNSSGQSFGVAVKLGTEGPAGPTQKVIMKAKLVTQSSSSSEAPIMSQSREKNKVRMPVASLTSPSDDSIKKNSNSDRVILRDEPASCLGSIEYLEHFPKLGQIAYLIEAPVYHPSEIEFRDPIKYINRIRHDAEQFGICKIIPPKSFKPECNVSDDMRFTAYNQYIQKMMIRWGSNTKEMAAIKKYLETQNVSIKPHPTVGGVEIDLPALYHAVQNFGGLTEVIQRKKWGKIAEYLRIPRGSQDRGNKLDDIYCKYLLPYDTLSNVERSELLRLVEEEYEEGKKREEKEEKEKEEKEKEENEEEKEDEDNEDDEDEDNEDDECVVKGKSTSLSQFYRTARNNMNMIFKSTNDPEPREVEEEYWRIVNERDAHVHVQQGSIDAGGSEGFGFPTSKTSSCGRHPWNLKILSNNPRSLLRTMGPVLGITVPTLHVGMLFTTGCWYRDPHGLPWIEYHHTGAPKIWYGIPHSHSETFHETMKTLVPSFCRNKKIWLPSDTTMVPPNLLVKNGVSVCRLVQEPGQFVVVFPKSYTSNISCGYNIAESVYYGPRDYISFAEEEFNELRESHEPMMFPLTKLFLCIASHEKTNKKTLRLIRPYLEKIRDNEYAKRLQIHELGVKVSERLPTSVSRDNNDEEEEEYECETCSANLYVSFVFDTKEDLYFCLDDSISYIQDLKVTQRKACKILYTHSKEEITALIKNCNRRLEEKETNGPEVNSSSEEDESSVISAIRSRIKSSENYLLEDDESWISPSLKKPLSPQRPFEYKSIKREKSEEKEQRRSCELGSKKKKKTPPPSSSLLSVSSSSQKRSARGATNHKTGNLACELLDMLLSTSEEESEENEEEESNSDESWK